VIIQSRPCELSLIVEIKKDRENYFPRSFAYSRDLLWHRDLAGDDISLDLVKFCF
jgi:hypothetical protein